MEANSLYPVLTWVTLFSLNGITNRNFVEDLSMIIPGQFGFNYPSGFREEAF
jgi:hypothetical protein